MMQACCVCSITCTTCIICTFADGAPYKLGLVCKADASAVTGKHLIQDLHHSLVSSAEAVFLHLEELRGSWNVP